MFGVTGLSEEAEYHIWEGVSLDEHRGGTLQEDVVAGELCGLQGEVYIRKATAGGLHVGVVGG